MNKSSNDHADAVSDETDSEDGHSDVFVRTKAAKHNISSIEEPAEDGQDAGFDTMKHNEKNIIASGQAGVIDS